MHVLMIYLERPKAVKIQNQKILRSPGACRHHLCSQYPPINTMNFSKVDHVLKSMHLLINCFDFVFHL